MSAVEEVWRTGALYTVGEVAKFAHVSPVTIKRWLLGYESGGRQRLPIFGHATSDVTVPVVSFLQLAEILVVSAFRKRRIHLDRIESAYKRAKMQLGVEYPFATLRLESIGGHILYEEMDTGDHSVLDRGDMKPLPGVVIETLHNFDYEDEFASRWYPLGRDVAIVVDPRYSAGIPTIEHRRVSASVILKRFHNAKQSIAFIANDLSLEPALVEVVIQNEDLIPV